MTTLNLVQRLLKKLSHLPTSYHLSSHLITPYPIYFRENYSFVTTLSLLPKLFKKLSHLVTAYDTLSHLNPTFGRKLFSVTALNLVVVVELDTLLILVNYKILF